jgi:hypothetical protein
MKPKHPNIVRVRCTDYVNPLAATFRQDLIPADDPRVTAQRKADAPVRPRAPQAPCNVGLFSDEPKQTDLVDLARRLTPRQ